MKKAVICLMLALCLCGTAAGCGKKEDEKVTTVEKKETPKEEKKEYQVIGNKTEEAYDILLKNSTGQDITGIAVKTSDKTEYPANMMKTDEVLKKGDTAELFYTPETAAASAEVSGTDKAVNIVYSVQITLADGKVFELSSLGFDDIKDEAELCLEDEVVFVKYVSKASGDSVSTKEQELGVKAQREAQEAAAVQAAQEAAAAQAAQEAAAAQNAEESYPVESYPEETYYNEYTPQQEAPAETPPVEEAPAQGSEGCLGGAAVNQ